LAGTIETGIQGSSNEWAIKFNSLTFNNFLFATGNFAHWAIIPKANIDVQSATEFSREFTSSSISAIPMNGEIVNNPA